MSNIKWLLKFSKESKKDFYMYCIIALLIVIIWLIIPLLVTKYTLLLTENSLKSLYHIGFIIFGIHFLYSFLKYFISYHAQNFFTTTYKNLHLNTIQNFLNTKYQNIEKNKTGYYIERMTSDTIDISDFFINVTDDIIDILINIGSLITIAHRLSTIVDCDSIIFLNNKKVEQIGTHEELLKTNSNYQKLYQAEIQKSN